MATAAVLLIAFALRLAVILPRIGRPADDPDNYLPLAKTLADGRGFEILGKPTAYRPPLYPLILPGNAGGTFTSGIAVLHLCFGVGTVAASGLAGRAWGLSDRRVLLCMMLVAVDPVLVVQSRSVMTETFAAFLLAVALAGSARPGWTGGVLGGVGFGLAGLCRPSTLAGAALAIVFSASTGRQPVRDRLARSAAMAATIAAVLAPWAIRNWFVLGEPIATTTHGGYTLALANNEYYYRDVLNGPPGAVWSGPGQRAWELEISRRTRGLPEPEADRILRSEGLRMLRERPKDFLRASLARLGRFWGLAPSGKVYGEATRAASAAWTLPFWALVATGLSRRETWRWPRASAAAVVVALSLVHSVFWTDLRMRAPVVPALALIAATARNPVKSRSEKNSEK